MIKMIVSDVNLDYFQGDAKIFFQSVDKFSNLVVPIKISKSNYGLTFEIGLSECIKIEVYFDEVGNFIKVEIFGLICTVEKLTFDKSIEIILGYLLKYHTYIENLTENLQADFQGYDWQ